MKYLPLTLILFLFAGCSGKEYEGPKRYAVSGKVTFDGEPVDGGIISFIPATEQPPDKQRTSGGPIVGGEYALAEGQGLNEGEYQVEVRWSKPTGKQIKDTADTGGMIDVTKNVIPDKYNVVTELRAKVGSGTNKFDFDLKSK